MNPVFTFTIYHLVTLSNAAIMLVKSARAPAKRYMDCVDCIDMDFSR